jgi:hypothetical protein
MARPLRVQFSGALYDVKARGNERKPIFRDERARPVRPSGRMTEKPFNVRAQRIGGGWQPKIEGMHRSRGLGLRSRFEGV